MKEDPQTNIFVNLSSIDMTFDYLFNLILIFLNEFCDRSMRLLLRVVRKHIDILL